MGETPFQNPANDEADERPGESPGERAQRLYEQQSGARMPGHGAGPGARPREAAWPQDADDEDPAGLAGLPGDGAPSA
jgi:hypothetical protein